MNKQHKTGKREKKGKTQRRRSMKGGSGFLTYSLNQYDTDTQLDNYATTRQMYNDQSVMNSRVLGGSRRRRGKTEKKTRGRRAGEKR